MTYTAILIIYSLLGSIYFVTRLGSTGEIFLKAVSNTLVHFIVTLVLWPLAVLLDVGCLLCSFIRRNK